MFVFSRFFPGSASFVANAGYFETRVLAVVADNPELELIIIDGQGINPLDATGEDHFFSRVTHALHYAWDQLGERYDRNTCPLRSPAVT